uniref:Uncharacterized protein n=1 Tax=Tetranychus urticae TaxID=32264 RepID=T1KU39_TETUR
MLGKMGCGSIKSTNKSDVLIEDIDTNIGSVSLMEVSEDRSMLVIAGELGTALVISKFSSPTEIIGKLVGHGIHSLLIFVLPWVKCFLFTLKCSLFLVKCSCMFKISSK